MGHGMKKGQQQFLLPFPFSLELSDVSNGKKTARLADIDTSPRGVNQDTINIRIHKVQVVQDSLKQGYLFEEDCQLCVFMNQAIVFYYCNLLAIQINELKKVQRQGKLKSRRISISVLRVLNYFQMVMVGSEHFCIYFTIFRGMHGWCCGLNH